MARFYLQSLLLLVVLMVISECRECKAPQVVKAASGTATTLNCPVNMTSGQQASQNISWVMLKGGNPVPVNSGRVKVTETSLVIQSVHYSDSGWYRCKYMNGQRCSDIILQVQDEKAFVPTLVPALTTSQIIWNTWREVSSGAFIAVVASVIIVIAITAALTRAVINRRRNTMRVAEEIWRRPPGSYVESIDAFEIGNLTPSEDLTNQRVNSLYQQFPEESLCSFHYK